jgi:hypothetical protein
MIIIALPAKVMYYISKAKALIQNCISIASMTQVIKNFGVDYKMSETNKAYAVKLQLTVDQLQSLIQHAEEEKEWHLIHGGEPEVREWDKVRDQLAYELDMITDYPWKS